MAAEAAVSQRIAAKSASFPISHFPFPLTERDLAKLWQDQTFPPEALVSSDGDRLRVIYRGRCSGGAGPDFRDAVIAASRGLLQGAVELHVRSSDFRRHGHDGDPAYAGVVLHVVFQDDEGVPTALYGGGAAPVVALSDWVRGRAAEIEHWLGRPALWREPCFSALRRQGAAEVAAALERLGDMRFRQKAAHFAARLRELAHGRSGMANRPSEMGNSPAEEILWEAVLEALGYGGDREAFRLLAERLPWSRLRARLAPLAAGDRAAEAWRSLAAAAVPASLRGGRRPANRPENRLKGAAQLASRFAGEGLVEGLAPVLAEEPAGDQKRLIALFTVPGAIGRGRAVEVVANAVLPWLAAFGPEASTRRAEALHRRLPIAASYGAVRHLHDAVGSGLAVDFRRQQGMLYLLKQYCTQGGCGRCPLS